MVLTASVPIPNGGALTPPGLGLFQSIKIADFGFAKIVSKLAAKADGKKLMETSCGTPE